MGSTEEHTTRAFSCAAPFSFDPVPASGQHEPRRSMRSAVRASCDGCAADAHGDAPLLEGCVLGAVVDMAESVGGIALPFQNQLAPQTPTMICPPKAIYARFSAPPRRQQAEGAERPLRHDRAPIERI